MHRSVGHKNVFEGAYSIQVEVSADDHIGKDASGNQFDISILPWECECCMDRRR